MVTRTAVPVRRLTATPGPLAGDLDMTFISAFRQPTTATSERTIAKHTAAEGGGGSWRQSPRSWTARCLGAGR